jgi:DNA-binding IclR family transcriptional regulator
MVSLERSTLVVRRADQRYVLGPFAFRLGKAYESISHVEEALLPLMHEMVRRGMESPSFHVRQDAETRVCLMRVDSNHSTLDRVRTGDLLPLKKGAPGKVLRRPDLSAAVEDPRSLIEASFGERDPSCAAVAGPVYGPGGERLGALSLSGPLERFTAASVKKMSEPLLAACEEATRRLGGTWPVARAVRVSAGRLKKGRR